MNLTPSEDLISQAKAPLAALAMTMPPTPEVVRRVPSPQNSPRAVPQAAQAPQVMSAQNLCMEPITSPVILGRMVSFCVFYVFGFLDIQFCFLDVYTHICVCIVCYFCWLKTCGVVTFCCLLLITCWVGLVGFVF